jgi:hypothetical protein
VKEEGSYTIVRQEHDRDLLEKLLVVWPANKSYKFYEPITTAS